MISIYAVTLKLLLFLCESNIIICLHNKLQYGERWLKYCGKISKMLLIFGFTEKIVFFVNNTQLIVRSSYILEKNFAKSIHHHKRKTLISQKICIKQSVGKSMEI